MITALTIREEIPEKLWGKIGAVFAKNPPRATLKTIGDDLAVLHVDYCKRRENVAWEKIEKQLGAGKKEVLYSGREPLPRGIKRYKSLAFMHRMAENASLEALSRLRLPPYCLKIGLFDPDGTSGSLLEHLLPFSSCITAVSGNVRAYIDKADEIMENSGAYISVHKNIGCLSACHVVIAPEKIKMELPLSSSAVVFTGEKPAVNIGGIIFDGYGVVLPKQYEEIRPDSISAEYFACALYDKGRQFMLGSLKPVAGTTGGSRLEMDDVCRFIKAKVDFKEE